MFYENLEKIVKECNFIDASRKSYMDNWPKISLTLTKDQIKKYMDTDIESLIFHCEQYANTKNSPNGGIIGSTKCYFQKPNKLQIQGSLTVLELMIDTIFNK